MNRPSRQPLVLTLLAALAWLGFASCAANAAIFYVTPTGTGNGSSWATASGSLQGIITAAHAGDQVWVKYGAYTGNFTATNGVTVYGHFVGTETDPSQRQLTKPIYASVLNANGSGTVYTIPSASTGTNTLDGFTVQGGTSRGIYDPSGDNLVIANSTVSNNSLTSYTNGGGLYSTGVTVNISNSTFTGNSVNGSGYTTITIYGGGVYTGSATTLTVSSSSFTGNSSNTDGDNAAYGGGICTAGTATISNSTINSNSASSSGGGVYASGNSISINGSTFTGNTGGGVYASANTNSISGSTFTNNSNRGLAVSGSNTSTIAACTFTGNSVTNANGGGLYAGSLFTTVTGCTFNSNSANSAYYTGATFYGGGLYTEVGTTSAISNCTFTGNSSNADPDNVTHGGGIGGYGTPYITNSTFTNNTPDEIDLENAGGPMAPALIADNLIFGAGTSAGNGINLGISGASTAFAYVTVSNNDIANANAAINIGTGAATGGAVSVANNIFYGDNGGVNYSASATFVSSHNDLFGNSYTYHGVALNASDRAVNPLFVSNPSFAATPVAYGNLHLMSTSALIDAGDDNYVSPGDTDLDGNPRIQGNHVDIGCYEAASATVLTSISGTVTLSGWLGTGEPTPTLTFTLTPTGATTPTITAAPTLTPTSSAGAFTYTLAAVPAGAYTLGVKGPLWLREDVPGGVNNTAGNVTGANVTLPPGDVNGDNVVDGNDTALLRLYFNTVSGRGGFNPGADLNGDGVVDGNDTALLRAHFNAVGAPF